MTVQDKQDLDIHISHMQVLKDWLGDSLTQKAFKKSIDVAIECMEKQIPKKLNVCKNLMTKESARVCPSCSTIIENTDSYCYECGQAIDWSEEDD